MTVADATVLDLNARQISALSRLFHRPTIIDFTVQEMNVALGIFGLTVTPTADGGKISYTYNGKVESYVFHKSHSAVKYIDRHTMVAIAKMLVKCGHVDEAIRNKYSLPPFFFKKIANPIAQPAIVVKKENESAQLVEAANGNPPCLIAFRLSEEYLRLLDPAHRQAFCTRLAQFAVNFYGRVNIEEKERQIDTILTRERHKQNDLLCIARLLRVEEDCPQVKRGIGIKAHFLKSFSPQSLPRLVSLLRDKILEAVPPQESGKTEKVAAYFMRVMEDIDKILRPIERQNFFVPVIVGDQTRLSRPLEGVAFEEDKENEPAGVQFEFSSNGIVIPKGTVVDMAFVEEYVGKGGLDLGFLTSVSCFSYALMDICYAVVAARDSVDIYQNLGAIARERRRAVSADRKYALENERIGNILRGIKTNYRLGRMLALAVAVFDRDYLGRDSERNIVLTKDYSRADIKKLFQQVIELDGRDRRERMVDSIRQTPSHCVVPYLDSCFYEWLGLQKVVGIRPSTVPKLFAKAINRKIEFSQFYQRYQSLYLSIAKVAWANEITANVLVASRAAEYSDIMSLFPAVEKAKRSNPEEVGSWIVKATSEDKQDIAAGLTVAAVSGVAAWVAGSRNNEYMNVVMVIMASLSISSACRIWSIIGKVKQR